MLTCEDIRDEVYTLLQTRYDVLAISSRNASDGCTQMVVKLPSPDDRALRVRIDIITDPDLI